MGSITYCDSTTNPKQICLDGTSCDSNILNCVTPTLCRCPDHIHSDINWEKNGAKLTKLMNVVNDEGELTVDNNIVDNNATISPSAGAIPGCSPYQTCAFPMFILTV